MARSNMTEFVTFSASAGAAAMTGITSSMREPETPVISRVPRCKVT